MRQLYRSQILDHCGRVAGMFDELGIAEVLDPATQRLMAPGIKANHLHAATRGRALDTRYAYGVTDLSSLMAATAAQRLGLPPTFAHLDRNRFHIDGRYKSAEEPEAGVMPITRGYSRDQRPDLHPVRLDLRVEPQAEIPWLMKPLRGNTSDANNFGQVLSLPLQQLPITDGTTYVVADSALYRLEHRPKLAATGSQWISWGLIYSEHRRPQAQRTVDKYLRHQSTDALKAFRHLYRMTFACEADAPPALAPFAHGLEATPLLVVTSRAVPHARKRGRPAPGMQPDQVRDPTEGALASSIAARETLVAQQRCFILAINQLEAILLPPQAVLERYQGQQHAERGVPFLKDPRFLASALSLNKPERIMALLMVMTVCVLVYAARAYRIRKARTHHEATFPHQKGHPIQNPTARWVFPHVVAIHLLRIPEQWPRVLHLPEEPQPLLHLLGEPYERFYA